MQMIEFISGLSGAVLSSALLMWLMRGWISERLKQSIGHEYSARLELHKAELGRQLQQLQHDSELNQLRTSLFFDHQRTAFAELLAKIVEVNQLWMDEGYELYCGLSCPVPSAKYREFRALSVRHQLFLDDDCLMAIDLALACYEDSFPFDAEDGAPPHARDNDAAYANVTYLIPRVAALFRQKIGVSDDSGALLQIALFGSMRALNNFHFTAAGVPPSGPLRITDDKDPGRVVMTAQENADDLLLAVRRFELHLRTGTPHFHEAQSMLSRYLKILERADRSR